MRYLRRLSDRERINKANGGLVLNYKQNVFVFPLMFKLQHDHTVYFPLTSQEFLKITKVRQTPGFIS